MDAARERFGIDPRSALLCGCVALVFVFHAIHLACVTEDAFITFRFASNLVAGHGFVWNVGEAPVEGYTNFLWLLISAATLAIGLDLPLTSQVLGVAAGLATLVYVYRCAIWLGGSARIAVLPALALACSGPFATWATSGMETSAFTLFAVAALFHHARYAETGASRQIAITSGALVVATLMRPEGGLLAVIIAGGALVAARGHGAARTRPVLIGFLIYAIVIALYVGWRWQHFGHPLPNTFYAKTGGGIAQALRGAEYAGLFALHFVAPWIVSVGLGLLGRPLANTNPAARALLRACVAIVALYSSYVILVGGDYMAMYRFFVPVLPCIDLLVMSAVVRSLRGVNATSIRAAGIKAGVLLGLLGTGFHSTPLESAWVEKPERMHGNYRGVEAERWYVSRHRLIGEFFARYGRPGESLATGAIGAVAYYSGLDVYDVHGIVDPHIAHEGRAHEELGTGLPGHEKTDYPYIFAKKPTFYVFSRKLRKQPLAGIPLLVPEVDDLVAAEYRVGSVFLEDRTNRQSGYFSFLERRDRAPRATPRR